MRPKSFSYTPADNSLTGFASNVTGATWTLSTTTPGDGLAHLVTIRNDAATDHSGKTAVLVGTDADGRSLTETLALPAGTATVTSTKYYKTLTSVTPSATINADTMDIGWSDVCITPSYVVNRPGLSRGGAASFAVDISGTINYDIQSTLDDVYASAESSCFWVDHATIANTAADGAGNYVTPIVAMRALVNSSTTGCTLTLKVIGA